MVLLKPLVVLNAVFLNAVFLNAVFLNVSLLQDLKLFCGDWNIVKIAFGKREKNYEIIRTPRLRDGTLRDDYSILKVYFPKGSYSPSKLPVGGIGFYANPRILKRATEATITYKVKFDETFDPVRGGKLPGLFINDGKNMKGAAGGKHNENASCRIAWRKNFGAEAYVYLPKQKFNPDVSVITNGRYGYSLWRNDFYFDPLIWNTVSLTIKLNTVRHNRVFKDGGLTVTINNTTRSTQNLIWRTSNKVHINTIIFETFFGGSSPKAATPHDTWIFFATAGVLRSPPDPQARANRNLK